MPSEVVYISAVPTEAFQLVVVRTKTPLLNDTHMRRPRFAFGRALVPRRAYQPRMSRKTAERVTIGRAH
ncbi:hypothetical protein KC356_g45 [Hortaea werneckii]|nr:hypothetical protein KC356_g45 [Hortaea werneckii]